MKFATRLTTLVACGALLSACGESPAPTPAPTPAAPESESMPMASAAMSIEDAIVGDHRSPGNAERNVYRHPVETLGLFGIEPGMTVVEVWPGGGTAWYTEVLAPVLGAEGTLIAAGYAETEEENYGTRAQRAFRMKMEADPDVYANVEMIDYADPKTADMAAPESVDAVLLFRLYHNAIRGGNVEAILADAYTALKPGGVLGVVQHRSPEDAPLEIDRRDGYVKVSTVKADAEKAGFVLEAESEINANPKDTHEHEQGVWTLPPGYALCGDIEDETAKAECMAPWSEIGESDRMTLKFVKPAM